MIKSSDAQAVSPRLNLSGAALVDNWRWLARMSGAAACGAAIKADGYGLGANAVLARLARAGCRDFFVATWSEAQALHAQPADGLTISILHGVRREDAELAAGLPCKPVLSSAAQARLWREMGQGKPCDVMVDTGINRLGLSPVEATGGLLDGLNIDTLMSHLASADQDIFQNDAQRALFGEIVAAVPARRASLANSAGICLGSNYHFDLTRPGLAIYGGVPRKEAAGNIHQVVFLEAMVLRVADIAANEGVGYNATWIAPTPSRIATVQLGYADGYLRGFSSSGTARWDGFELPVVGRVSMDLVTLLVPPGCPLAEGDWVSIDYDLPASAATSGLSQYELLTGLGQRAARIWY